MGIIIQKDGQLTQFKTTKQLTGEKMPGDLDSWEYYGTDPNNLLTLSYGLLSKRSTTLYHTHGPVSAAINKTCAYAVGPGLVFRSQPDWNMLGVTKKVAKEWGMKFQRLIHYYFLLLNFYEKQSLIFRTADIMGDSLLLFDRKDTPDDLPFDLIETGGDQIAWDQTYPAQNSKKAATLGIQHDKFLRKLGIIMDDSGHTPVDFKDENGDQNLIQFFQKRMARQLRGMPLAYKVIALAKNNDRWWDAMLQRAVMETIMMGYKQGGNPDDLDLQVDNVADVVVEGSTDSTTGLKQTADTKQLGGGGIYSFESNESLQFTDLKTPSNNFDKMQNSYLECLGMAMDVPPEVMKSMYSTSFTAHKGALNDFVKFYMAKRNTLISTCNNVVVRELAKYIFMTGQLEMPHPAFFTDPIIRLATLSGNWLGPVPGHINPKVEVEAKALEVKNAFKTRADAAAEYGNEFDDHIEEWQQQQLEWHKGTPDQMAQTMQDQEDELNNGPDDDNNNDDNDDNNDGGGD